MIKRASLIIIAISFHCNYSFATQPFELNLRLYNDSSQILPASEVCGLMPLALNAKVRSWEISASLPSSLLGKAYCLRHDEMGPYQSQRISIHWSPLKASGDFVRQTSGAYDLVESPSPQLLQLANSFSEYPQADRAKQIHAWLVANIHFSGIRRGIEGAEHALRTRSGDCTEHMLLAGELLERNGVTIRRVLGVAIPKGERRVTAATLHNWIEYQDNGSWLVFDSSKKVLGVPESEDYISLLFYQHSQQLFIEPFSSSLPRTKLFLQ